MTDAEEQLEDLSAQLNLPVATIAGVCSELARNPDHAQRLQLCQQWGIGWPELQRLSEIRPQNLHQIGKGLATQGAMIAGMAQNALAQKLSNPAVLASLEPNQLSTIMKQGNDVALSWVKESPATMGGGNTFNIIGANSSIQDILNLKAQRNTEKPAIVRLLERATPTQEISTNPLDY